MAGRRVRGAGAFRKLLNRMPAAIREEMVRMLDEAGSEILAREQADAPKRTGALAQGLTKRVYPATLRVRIGIIGRPAARRLFYGRIIEKGVRPQTVIASRNGAHRAAGGKLAGRRSRALRAGVRGVYLMHIRGRAARPFVLSPATRAIRDTMAGRLAGFWDRVLAKAAQGAGNE